MQGCSSQSDTSGPLVLSLASPGACLCNLTDVHLLPNYTVMLPNFFLDTIDLPLGQCLSKCLLLVHNEIGTEARASGQNLL